MREIKKGRKVGVNMWRSLPKEGLNYGPFVGVAAEDIRPGGWDVVEVMPEGETETRSVYSFSVYIGRDGGR